MQNPAPYTKFVFGIRENTEGDSDLMENFVFMKVDDSVLQRLNKHAEMAKAEQVTIIMKEFNLCTDPDLTTPLSSAGLTLAPELDPILDLNMSVGVKNGPTVSIESEEELLFSDIELAVGVPTHMKKPVVLKISYSSSVDMIIFDETELADGDLLDAVAIAQETFISVENDEDIKKAIDSFINDTGVQDVFFREHRPEDS